MTAFYIIGGVVLFLIGFSLGTYYGAGMGIRIFAPDILAIVEGRTDELQYKELQDFIHKNVQKAKAKTLREEFREHQKELEKQGIT